MPTNAREIQVLRHRVFRSVWIATLVSNLGLMAQLVGAAWMMTTLTDSQGMVALVQSAHTLPIMLAALAAGVLADNFDRRRVMLVAQSFMLIVAVVLTLLAQGEMLTPWLLLAFTFLIGCGTAMHNPSWQASLGDIVPRGELPSAVSINAMGYNITRSIGPAIGGAIVASAGVAAAFAFNALTYVALIAALLSFRSPPRPSRLPRERFAGAMAAGLRYFAMSPYIMGAVLRAGVFTFGAIAVQALAPLVARDLLGGDAITYGIVLGAFGAGAVAGALTLARWRSMFPIETICRVSHLAVAAAFVVVALSGNLVVTCLAVFLSGVGWLSTLSSINANVQLSTPRWVLGRMLSLYMTGIFGGMALGSWVWGLVTEAWGLPLAFVAAGAAVALATFLGWRWPLRQHGVDNLDPLDPRSEPELRLEIAPNSGPIVIVIEYDIAEEDLPDFLEAMVERRRIRIRDGAHHWVLQRDIEHPDLWQECYRFPTWLEYVRHVERRTQADYGVTERLRRLHRGAGGLRVHRMIERPATPATGHLRRVDPDDGAGP